MSGWCVLSGAYFCGQALAQQSLPCYPTSEGERAIDGQPGAVFVENRPKPFTECRGGKGTERSLERGQDDEGDGYSERSDEDER